MIPQLIFLLGVLLLAVLALRATRANEMRANNTVQAQTGNGTFEDYLARIETLTSEGHDGFFVTATEETDGRFVQLSAGRDNEGTLRYQFSIPITEWSRGYAVRIEAEARHRGFHPIRQTSGPMTFLDIDFDTSGDHAVFARWVVNDVYQLPSECRFALTWG